MNRNKKSSLLQHAAALLILVNCAQPVLAGQKSNYLNSNGFGRATNAITFNGVTINAVSPAMQNPCAAVNIQAGFSCPYTQPLPPGCPTTVYCESIGQPTGFWANKASVTGGATGDNEWLDSLIQVIPANCASITVTSTEVTNADGFSGTFIVTTTASSGAAIGVRGIEYLAPGGQPQDFDDLQTNGVLKWQTFLAGPFDLNTSNCTALVFPFTTQTGVSNMFLVLDTDVKSTPFTITCPNNVTFGCADAIVYPPAQVSGGCGNITVKYDPPTNTLPFAVSTVTVTATDEAGDTAQCTFVADASAKGIPFTVTYPTNDLVFGCADTVAYPAAKVSGGCGNVIVSYNPPASTLPDGVKKTVTVTAQDSIGRTVQCTFLADTTARGIPLTITCPSSVVFGCGAPVVYPAAQAGGGCGNITVSYNPPTNALPFGTNTVTVTAADTHGHTAQCTFTATRQMLGFTGFYPPIGGTGGACGNTLRTINRGSIIPVKFDTSCNSSPYLGGQPTLAITQCPSLNPFLTGNFQLVANEWHFNWDTSGLQKGDYQLIVTLQDGSTQAAVVTLK